MERYEHILKGLSVRHHILKSLAEKELEERVYGDNPGLAQEKYEHFLAENPRERKKVMAITSYEYGVKEEKGSWEEVL